MITNVYITFRSGHINHKQRGFSSVTFAAPVIINGKRGNVAVVVQQKGKNKYHVHRILMPDGSKFVYENIQQNAEPTSDSIAEEISRKRLSISPASTLSIAQNSDLSTVSSKKVEDGIKSSRKTVDPITSREALAKALSKVAKGEDRAIVESYKANVNLIKGETERLNNLRKEIDEIKYKKSITYEGRELSVKEFEQIAYTRAEEMGIEAEKVKIKKIIIKDHDKKS